MGREVLPQECLQLNQSRRSASPAGMTCTPSGPRKYDYCMKPDCQAKNLKGLTMVAVGVNKSAEQYLLLDEDTQADLAKGKYHDQRRGTFGQPGPAPGQAGPRPAGDRAPGGTRPARCCPGEGRAGPGAARPGGRPPPAAAAGHGVAATAGGPVQPAGPAPRRDRPQTGAEPVRRHPDHPGGQEPRQALSHTPRPAPARSAVSARPLSAPVRELGPDPEQPDRAPVGESLQRGQRRFPEGVRVGRGPRQ